MLWRVQLYDDKVSFSDMFTKLQVNVKQKSLVNSVEKSPSSYKTVDSIGSSKTLSAKSRTSGKQISVGEVGSRRNSNDSNADERVSRRNSDSILPFIVVNKSMTNILTVNHASHVDTNRDRPNNMIQTKKQSSLSKLPEINKQLGNDEIAIQKNKRRILPSLNFFS